MKEKQKAILQRHLDKLSDKDFDLDAWKSGVSASIKQIFPDNWSLSSQIENLKIENSSWTLRDSGADHNPLESAKKKGLALLESAMDELELSVTDPKELFSKYLDEDAIGVILNSNINEKDKLKALSSLKKGELAALVLKLI
jgi:hypothetical protein